MDLPVQHDFTLARLWAWMKVELSEHASSKDVATSKETSKSAASGIDRQEPQLLRRFSPAEKEIGSTVDVPCGKASGSSPISSSKVTGEHPCTTPDSLISDSLNNFDVTPMLRLRSPVDVEDRHNAMQEESQEEASEGSSPSTEQTSSSSSVMSEVETCDHTLKRIVSPTIVDPPLDKVIERTLPPAQLWTKPDSKKYDNQTRSRWTDGMSEEMEKKISQKYDIKLRAEIKKLAHSHQQEIEHLKQTCTAETLRANQSELERGLLAKELARQESLVVEQDKVIADKVRDARNAYVAADTLHAQLCGNVPCAELMRNLFKTESDLRKDLRIVVEQNRELQQSLKMANEQIKEGKGAMSRVGLEFKDQATNLKQTTKLLRADDIKSAFLDTVQDNAAEMTALRAQLQSRIQEIQELYRYKTKFEQSMYNDVAAIQDKAFKKLDEIRIFALKEADNWRIDINIEQELVRRLKADKERLETEKNVLTQRLIAYSAEDQAMKKVLDRITALTQDIVPVDGSEHAQSELNVTRSNKILAQFQDMVLHFEAKIAALQRQADGHEAESSREIDEDWGTSLVIGGNSEGEDTDPSKGAENLAASLSGGVALDPSFGGPAEQENEPANSDEQKPKVGHTPTILTNLGASIAQAPPLSAQTPNDTASGLQESSHSPELAPGASIDPSFENVSSGPIFDFTPGQNSSGTQAGLVWGTTPHISGFEQSKEGEPANVEINFSHHNVLFNGGLATAQNSSASRERLGPKSRVSKPARRGGAK